MTRPVTLLVVDDDESARSMLSRRLERSGFRVFTAGSGAEALERLPSLGADVMLLDYEMPEMNGIETLRRLRRLYGKSELAVIMATAHNDSRVVVDTLKEGADDFVTKPIDFPVVLARIGVQVARKEAEQALRDSEERYALVARATNDGFWDWRLAAGEVYFSSRWTTMLGFEEHEFGSSPDAWFARVHPDDAADVQTQLVDLIEARTDTFESEHRVQHKEGHYIWVRNRALAVRDSAGRPQRIVGSQADVTEGKVADALTGLPNRLLFMDRLTRCLHRRRRFEDFHFAVLFLDLDGFKDVNDSLGHLAGDELLIAVGHRLEASVRATDMVGRPVKPHTVARFGGDEFTVLLEDLQKPSDALLVAERLQIGLAQAFSVSGQEVFTTASIGIVLDTDGYERPEDLLRDADTAMYKAKAGGRTQYAVFDAALREVAVERLTLGTDLKKAVDRAEFLTYYQPIVNLATGAIAGFEALVRWQHAKRGIVSPGEFITAAEGTGLIVSIGRIVLEQSCADLRRWQVGYAHAAEFVMSVNLSGKELMRDDLIESVRSALEQAGLPAPSVKFEITESLLMENPGAVTERLVALRALGIQLGIDDFGTGYSSLSYLHRFPVNTLKIDRSFVSRLGPGSDGNEIVGTIVALAHNLGLDTVAEGIETPDQLGRLRALGCEFGQGFLFARPLPFDDAERLIAARPVWAPPSITNSR